ncbi:unnamed protein product [Effrenium voratum]|nr:unnamed protein product [Effrenium voratum]
MEQPEREISRIARFILPHRQVTDELLRTARLQSTKDFMQEHISKFDDHFVLKHLPVFKQDVKAYGLVPRIPRVMRQTPKELPRAVQELLAARWQSYVGESGFASYRELRTWLRADPLNKQGELNDDVTQGHFWKGVLFLLAAACVIAAQSTETEDGLQPGGCQRNTEMGSRSCWSKSISKSRLVARGKLAAALAEQDLEALEEALALCKERRLPCQGAEETLCRWRAEAAAREAAERQLEDAFDSEDLVAVKAALVVARPCFKPQALHAAEERLGVMEALMKRREMARLELCLALNARVISRLQAAVESAKTVSLPSEQLQEAEEALQDWLEEERQREELLAKLEQALQQRDVKMLQKALREAQMAVSHEEPPIQRASLLLAQWEEEAKREQEVAQRQRAAEEIQEAIEDGDWDTIESAVQAGLESGLEEEAEPVRAARAKLESLREARELHEAKRTIQQTEARLQQLQQAEAQLAGPSHKKERSAIGKEMMKLRNGEEYISARSFLKNPEQVRPGS